MSKTDFQLLVETLVEMGYEKEIEWQRNLQPVWNAEDFYLEACWVILNSGMKEQIARIIWERIATAWGEGKPASSVFRHKGKCDALEYVKSNKVKLFGEYVMSGDKIETLLAIPYIGKITCFHLAKNLGHDCVKPDRHLVRIANKYKTTPDEMCDKISKQTGEKKSVVDIVIWRACNLGII